MTHSSTRMTMSVPLDKQVAIVMFERLMTPELHKQLIIRTYEFLKDKDRRPPVLEFRFKHDFKNDDRHISEIPYIKSMMADAVRHGMLGCLLKLGYRTEADQLYACAFLTPTKTDEGLHFAFPPDRDVLTEMTRSLAAFASLVKI